MAKLKTSYLFPLFIFMFIVSCGNNHKTSSSQDEQEIASKNSDITYNIDTSSSEIQWEGSKPLGKHNGVVLLKLGEMKFKNDTLVAGKFIIDMNSIVNLDLDDQSMKNKLVSHLKSQDFFAVETFPVSEFQITKSMPITYLQETQKEIDTKEKPNYRIMGNLTIKGVTRNIGFDVLVNIEKDSIWARSVPLYIDRTEWNVNYKSKKVFKIMKDKFIDDQIGLKIDIIAHKKE
ncbi:MAG: YceI family protein [Bacteroidales bacterium]